MIDTLNHCISQKLSVVFISMVACETGMSTRLWMVCSAAAGSIFGVGIIAMLIKMISIAQRQGTKLIRDAVSEIFLVVPVRIAYLYFNQSFLGKVRVTMIACVCFQTTRRHVYINEDKWKLPVENIVFQNKGGHSVGNPAVTRCTETDQMTCAEFPREETFEQDVNSVNGSESSSKYNERILSESQIERSFGNNATIDFPISDVSKKIGYTKQKLCQHILLESTQQEDWLHLNGCVLGYIPEIASCKDRDSVNSQISLEVYENDLMDTDEDSFLAISAEEINTEHVEQDLWKWSHLDKTYGENTQRNCVAYPTVRSCTEIDSVISQTSLEIYENDIMETDQITCAEFPSEGTFKQDVNCNSSGHLSVNGNESSCKQNDQMTSAEFPKDETFEQDVNSHSSGYLSVFGNESVKDNDQITCAEFPKDETFEQDVNSHSFGHLSVTANESSKDNEVILSEFSIERSFGNSATLDLPSSDVSKKIGHTKQKICQHILPESTQQEHGTHLNGCSSGYMSVNASCKKQDQMTCAEFPNDETFEQDVNSHFSGYLSVNGNESGKDNEEVILSEFPIEISFGNSATLNLPSSDVSKKIGYTKQKICQHILVESTKQEDGIYLNGCLSGYMSVNASCKNQDQMTCAEFPREETFEQDVNYHSSGHLSVTGNESCKQNADSKRLDWYSEQSDGKDHPDSKVKENEDDLCSRETIKCQLDRVEEWLISNDFERMNTDIDDYTGCGENEMKRFENSITQCNKECKCEKISKDKAITDISCLTRSCSNIKAKCLNKDNDSGQLDSFPDAHPLHDRSKANLHEHFETHAKIKGNFQTNPLHCISITPKTESMLYPQESQRDSNETKTIASSSRKSNSLQNISNNESKHKIKTSLLDTNPAPLTLPDPFHRDVLVVV